MNVNFAFQSSFKNSLLCIVLFAVCLSCSVSKKHQTTTKNAKSSKILIQNPPETLNPKIIQAFLPWASDNQPSIAAIDLVEANDNNQFYVDIIEKDGKIGFMEEGSGFSYSYLGSTSNGGLVYKTYTATEGTAVFVDVLVFRQSENIVQINQSSKKQVLLELEAYFCIGVHNDAEVKIEHNQVILSQSCTSEKPFIYESKPQ